MKLTLTITASASALANILSLIESDDGEDTVKLVVGQPSTPQPVETFNGVPLPVFPAAAAPAAAVMPEVVAAAPTVAGEPEFDSTGLAWDERIHSKQKGQTNDGKWRKQRGVDEAFYNAVEAELRARYSGVAQPATGNVATPMPSPVPAVMEHGVADAAPVQSEPVQYEPVAPIPMPVSEQVAPTPIPMPVAIPAPVAAPAPVVSEGITFHTVMMHVGTAMSSGKITPDYLVQLVNEINQQCGTTMQSFTDMAAFPNAVEYCWAAFGRDGKL